MEGLVLPQVHHTETPKELETYSCFTEPSRLEEPSRPTLCPIPASSPSQSTECRIQGEVSRFSGIYGTNQLCVGFPLPMSPFPFRSPGLYMLWTLQLFCVQVKRKVLIKSDIAAPCAASDSPVEKYPEKCGSHCKVLPSCLHPSSHLLPKLASENIP